MKVTVSKTIQIGDVTPNRRLRLDAIVNILQETAIEHTRQVGIELSSLLDSGRTWVLSKIAVDLRRLPKLDEKLEVQTWSRSIQRFKGLRDFHFSIAGEHVASASTLWLYLDIARKRPVRVPDHYEALYDPEDIQATIVAIEQWEPSRTVTGDAPLTITTRVSDYDVNGHVNNAAILQYIQTALTRAIGPDTTIQSIRLVYLKEIPEEVRDVAVIIEKHENCCHFQVGHASTVFASGTIETTDDIYL